MTIIGARYNSKYSITAENLNILAPCVRTLLDRTESLYTPELERIKAQKKPQRAARKVATAHRSFLADREIALLSRRTMAWIERL